MNGDRPVRAHVERAHLTGETVPVRARVRAPGWPGVELEIEAESLEALTHNDPSAWRRES